MSSRRKGYRVVNLYEENKSITLQALKSKIVTFAWLSLKRRPLKRRPQDPNTLRSQDPNTPRSQDPKNSKTRIPNFLSIFTLCKVWLLLYPANNAITTTTNRVKVEIWGLLE